MSGPISEVTVRRQTGSVRKQQAKAAKKRLRLRGGRRPKRLTAKQKAAVRKRKGTGFYKKIARLRASLDLPATITGSISHRPEYIDLVLEVAAEFKDEKQSAREFAKLFIEKDPAFSNTDTGLAAILFEAYLFEKSEDVVKQFLETQLEGSDTTFLAIFEGQIKDEPLKKLATGVRDICTFEALVKAGDTNHEEGSVSDVTILECNPKRQKKSKAAAQEPEPSVQTEGLLPYTKADYEAVIEEGGITDNAFMYLYPHVWEAATGTNGDIRTATEATGVKWYCYEGIWLPDVGSIEEAQIKISSGKVMPASVDRVVAGLIRTLKDPDAVAAEIVKQVPKAAKAEKNIAFLIKRMQKKGARPEDISFIMSDVLDTLHRKGKFALSKSGPSIHMSKQKLKKLGLGLKTIESEDGDYYEIVNEADEFTGTARADIKSTSDIQKVKAKVASILGKLKGATSQKVKHYLAGPNGDKLAQAIGAGIERKISLKAVSDPKAWLSVMSTVIHGKAERQRFEQYASKKESVQEATLDQAIKKSKLRPGLVKNFKRLLKGWMKKSGLGDLTNIANATVFIDGDKVQVNVKPHKGDRKQFNTRMDQLEEGIEEAWMLATNIKAHGKTYKKGWAVKMISHRGMRVNVELEPGVETHLLKKEIKHFTPKAPKGATEVTEGFEALFATQTRANRFAREIRTHARAIRPKGTQVYYEAREDHADEIAELCRKHGGKKKKAKRIKEDEEDSHTIVAGPFCGDGEPRPIHNGHCEVIGFQKPLQSGPLYLESEEGFQSKFLAWTVRKEGTDDGKVLVHVGSQIYRLPASLSEMKGLLDKMEEFYEDLPDEFDSMVEAFLVEYCTEKGTALGQPAIESIGLSEALEDWTSHEFIASRDARIQTRCRLRRLAMGEDLDTVSRLRDLDEARLVIRTEKGKQANVLKLIRKRDPAAKVDSEKNPITAWVTTKLTVSDIEHMTGVKDVVLASQQEDLDEDENTCIIEVAQIINPREIVIQGHVQQEAVAEMHLFIDGEDMGHVDDTTVSAMVGGFKAAGLGALKVGEKATTRTVKCPECGSKVLAATGYCVSCKKKTIKEDLDEARRKKAKQEPTDDNISNYIRDTLSGTDRFTDAKSLFGVAKRSFKGLTMKQFMAAWNALVKEGYLKKRSDGKYMWESARRTGLESIEEAFKKGKKVKWTAPDGTKMSGTVVSDVGPNYDIKVRVTSPKPKKGEEEVLVKRGRLKEGLDEVKAYFIVTPIEGGGHRIGPATTKADAFQAAKQLKNKGAKVVLATSAKDAAKRVKRGEYVMEDDLDEAKLGLTLEKIRMGGEYQSFKVLKNKSLVGFLMQTGKNTATEEHPWKAFRVAQGGRVGEKIGFYYKRDGGKSAALQAIAKTALESIEVTVGCLQCGCEWATTLDEATTVPSCPQCGCPGHLDEQLRMGDGVEIRLPKGSRDYENMTSVSIEVDHKPVATATRKKGGKKWLLKFKKKDVTSSDKKKAQAGIRDFHMKYVESIEEAHYYTVAGALSRGELQKKLGVTLVGYATGALGKVGARLIQTKQPIKDAAAKAGLKVTKISKAKFMELAESEDLVEDYRHGGYIYQARTIAPTAPKHQGKAVIFRKKGISMAAPREVWTGSKWVRGSQADMEDKAKKYDNARKAATDLKKVAESEDNYEDLDEALHLLKGVGVEQSVTFGFTIRADEKKEITALRKALKSSTAGRTGGVAFKKVRNPKWLRFTISGTMQTKEQAIKVVQDITGIDLVVEDYEVEVEQISEARAGAMTGTTPGVGKITEPTHMKALARKAGKSAKKALFLWGRAQAKANEQYPEFKAAKGKGGKKERRYYKVVTAIFKSMLGLGKEESEQTDPIIAEVLCHSCRSATEVFLYPHSVGVCGECGSVHVTPTGEMHYATEEEIAADKKLNEEG